MKQFVDMLLYFRPRLTQWSTTSLEMTTVWCSSTLTETLD